MSYTSLYELCGDVVAHENTFKNSHGSAHAIWECISRKHPDLVFDGIAEDPFLRDWRERKGEPRSVMGDLKALEQLWALHKRDDLPWYARVTLMTTFDGIAVKRDDFIKVADAFVMFGKEYATDWRKRSVYSVDEQAGTILVALDKTPEVEFIGWCQTSCAESAFVFGPYDEVAQEYAEFSLAHARKNGSVWVADLSFAPDLRSGR